MARCRLYSQASADYEFQDVWYSYESPMCPRREVEEELLFFFLAWKIEHGDGTKKGRDRK
jgi:hypothetical protein